jgi:succinylglutamate desuccinylase
MTPKQYANYLRKLHHIKRKKATKWYAVPEEKTIYGPPWKTNILSFLSELHEIAHVVLNHTDDTYTAYTLHCEITAWIWALYHAMPFCNITPSIINHVVSYISAYQKHLPKQKFPH